MKLGLPFGISVFFWTFIGIIRYLTEEYLPTKRKTIKPKVVVPISRVAACVPAHNEERAIAKTIKSLKKNIPAKDIYIASDGSTDKTAEIARAQKCNVIEINPGKGKARALTLTIKKMKLLSKYDFLIIVDADTRLDANYVSRALEFFAREKGYVAIAAYALPYWRNYRRITKSDFISAYRTRLYRILQWVFMYGQTWRYTNVNPVIPGFAAIYKTSTLKELKLYVPGIWIEDFSLAFQIHKNNLGKIGHLPKIFAVYDDPRSILDYARQVRRWNIGFLQTVKYYGIWPSAFWLSLGLFTIESLLFTLFTLLLPITVLLLSTQYYAPVINPSIITVSKFVSDYLVELWGIFVVFFLIDYALTVIVALKDKKYSLLFYGLGFLFFQYLNSLIFVSSLPKGLFGKSQATWTPVKRK